jgi:demethylmenaquinone methyltransferase/2-methoxy-6-polyprenyl-1,4-benzoquinol methylase
VTISPNDISRMFSRLAPRYDRFNRWSSLGLDGVWRRALISRLRPGGDVLDMGCGTGDLTLLAAAAGHRAAGLDFSEEMLEVARKRGPGLTWTRASAAETGFPDGRFDAVVSAYVMRNLYRGGLLDGSLREARRVLRQGGRLLFLDLTRPRNALLRWGHAAYMRTVLPLVGRVVCGADWPGDYLKTSIEDLPSDAVLRAAFESAGFTNFQVAPLSGGIVSLFIAERG